MRRRFPAASRRVALTARLSMFTTLSQGYRMQRAHCRRDLSGDADVPDQYRLIHHLVFRQIEPPVKRTHKGCGLAAGAWAFLKWIRRLRSGMWQKRHTLG